MAITIDGKNIKTKWGLDPVMDGYLSELMKFPDAKDRISNDWSDQDGLDVLLSATKLKAREITINFFCDTYANYVSFMKYLVAHPNVTLIDDTTTESYILEYMACSSFNRHREYNTFAIKFREANPKARIGS